MGCGALWETQWVQVAWSEWPKFSSHCHVGSILDCLLPLSVVAMVRGGYCRDPAMPHMLGAYFFLEAKYGEITVLSMKECDAGSHLSEGDMRLDSVTSSTTVQVQIKASKTDPFRKSTWGKRVTGCVQWLQWRHTWQ